MSKYEVKFEVNKCQPMENIALSMEKLHLYQHSNQSAQLI